MNILRKKIMLLPLGVSGLFSLNSCKQPIQEYNVIYILADDLGYGDLGCYGQKFIKTPNIDKLASQGMIFTQHYAGSTVSAPSRSSLITGQHTGHTYIRGNIGGLDGNEGQEPIPSDTYTLAEMFKHAGYVTGAFGKWGLGSPGSEGDPTNQGFDDFFGYNCQALAHKHYPEHLWDNRKKNILEDNNLVNKVHYAPDIIHSRALDFIKANHDQKFFAFLPYTLPHAELLVPEDSIIQRYREIFHEEHPYNAKSGDYSPEGKSQTAYCSQTEPRAQFAAMVTRLDHYVGEVIAQLEHLGIRDKTIVIFTSDNGPHREGGADPDFFTSYGPLRGTKRDMWEGGIRVPMIASCPTLISQGAKSDHVSAFWDILPTFADMTGVKINTQIDGISMMPALTGKGQQKQHEYLYWEFHEAGGKIAVRMGEWKGVRLDYAKNHDSSIKLFNLQNDLHEDNNIADKHPDIVKKIEQIMSEAHTESALFNFGQKDGKM